MPKQKLKSFLQTAAFILIGIGLVSLLLNEFLWHGSTAFTLTLAAVNFSGLIILFVSHFLIKV